MSGSRIIIAEEDRLPNPHPGEFLREDFLVGSELPVEDVVAATGIDAARLTALLDGVLPVDADLDIRLTHYFGISEGLFLRLQNDYDLEEAWLAKGADLGRIVPRAA